jgi:hypothetical protein
MKVDLSGLHNVKVGLKTVTMPQTQVLKMVGMGSDEDNLMDYFKKIKVVTVSMSYEYDPTDVLLSYWLRPITKCMSRKRMKIS